MTFTGQRRVANLPQLLRVSPWAIVVPFVAAGIHFLRRVEKWGL